MIKKVNLSGLVSLTVKFILLANQKTIITRLYTINYLFDSQFNSFFLCVRVRLYSTVCNQ